MLGTTVTCDDPTEWDYVLRIGRDDGLAFFSPSLYRLTVRIGDVENRIDLGYSGSRLLQRLLRRPGELVERGELLDYAWNGRVVGQGSLNQQVHTLRRALSDGDGEIIRTVPRRGYVFNPLYLHKTPQRRPASSRRRWAVTALSGIGLLARR